MYQEYISIARLKPVNLNALKIIFLLSCRQIKSFKNIFILFTNVICQIDFSIVHIFFLVVFLIEIINIRPRYETFCEAMQHNKNSRHRGFRVDQWKEEQPLYSSIFCQVYYNNIPTHTFTWHHNQLSHILYCSVDAYSFSPFCFNEELKSFKR